VQLQIHKLIVEGNIATRKKYRFTSDAPALADNVGISVVVSVGAVTRVASIISIIIKTIAVSSTAGVLLLIPPSRWTSRLICDHRH